jgi:hypothetical protein
VRTPEGADDGAGVVDPGVVGPGVVGPGVVGGLEGRPDDELVQPASAAAVPMPAVPRNARLVIMSR